MNFNFIYSDIFVVKVSVLALFSVIILLFCTVWMVRMIQHLIIHIKLYRTTQKKEFRDNRERDRLLYNYETHIVKDIILIFICLFEFLEPFLGLLLCFLEIFPSLLKLDFNFLPFSRSAQCSFLETLEETNHNVQEYWFGLIFPIYFYLFKDIGYIGFLILLSFLASYLSKRYFLHNIERTTYMHALSFFIQSIIVSISSNRDLPTEIFIL